MDKDIMKVGELSFPKRQVWIKTFGCQMNHHDTERILSYLKELNFEQTENRDNADLIIFNTCAIRDLANSKFYSHLGELKEAKKKRSDLLIGVGGCVAQSEGRDLIKKYKHLDFAFGTDVIDSIPDMIYRLYSGDTKFAVNTWDKSSNYSIETKITHKSPQAFVNIIKGCDKFCSYCIVPFTRGREKSRKLTEVVDDCKRLVEYQGIQEITLLGQNVNSYGKENNENLSELIMALDDLNGLKLLRYTTSHPYDVSDELVAVHGSAKKLAKNLHLPVQSGSNSVLSRMLREYSVEHYLGLVEKLRAAQPEIVLSTDIIVGFPNETDQEHADTLKLLETVKYDSIFSFVFSARAGTKAARVEDTLAKEIKSRRLRELQQFQLNIQQNSRQSLVGETFEVLVEREKTMKGVTKWMGRSSCNRIIHFQDEQQRDLQWKWLDVKVLSATALSCQGQLV